MNRSDLIPHTIIAACVLHNLCLLDADSIDEYVQEGMAFINTIPATAGTTAGNAASGGGNTYVSTAAALLRRDYIAETLPMG